MTMDARERIAEYRRSPKGLARSAAFEVIMRHGDCLQDDVPLDDLIEDIAQAILKGVNISDGEQVNPEKEG